MGHTDIVVACARSFLGTKFKHQGRVPNVGLDCVGLLIAVAKVMDFKWTDRRGYARCPDGVTLMHALDEVMDRASEPAVGRVVMFEHYKGLPYHVGIITDYEYGGFGLIHTWAEVGKVVEEYFEPDESVVGYWKWRR